MKLTLLPTSLLFVAALVYSSLALSGEAKGFKDAEFDLIDGSSLSLKQFKGKRPIYLKFWASWCLPCLKEMPHFEAIYQQYGKSVQVISVNLGINDSPADVERIINKYGLKMPTAIDSSGELARIFNFVGTPYHLVFDKELNLVHRGHSADESLDNKIALLASQGKVEVVDSGVLSELGKDPLDLSELFKGKSAIYFTATWCDWYLKETKPSASANCEKSQLEFNKLQNKYQDIKWLVVVSNLWTGDADLAEYKNKYQLSADSYIDKDNGNFVKFGVKDFPTLVLLEEGAEQYRTTAVAVDGQLEAALKRLSSPAKK